MSELADRSISKRRRPVSHCRAEQNGAFFRQCTAQRAFKAMCRILDMDKPCFSQNSTMGPPMTAGKRAQSGGATVGSSLGARASPITVTWQTLCCHQARHWARRLT
ncbi:hypothetical protein JCM7686_1267 [Paracoccus aminophilus JCM 7686]|uniref:Uncharacterized protein n=1 Tax=Paracoccus aminophilus JCM 7686 TaxID=1367847 RepID=S5YAB4_PARAH|nr:hypothetical protein JCM7686_1267 [Paracoccus aminophilus JCM 7686]